MNDSPSQRQIVAAVDLGHLAKPLTAVDALTAVDQLKDKIGVTATLETIVGYLIMLDPAAILQATAHANELLDLGIEL